MDNLPVSQAARELLREARDWLSSIGLPGGVTDDLRDRIDAYLSSATQEPAPSSERELRDQLGPKFKHLAGEVAAELVPALVEGLHAQVFGIHSMGDPELSHQALADGGQIHEAVHALVRALPTTTTQEPALDLHTLTDAFIREMDARGAMFGKPPLEEDERKAVAEMMERALKGGEQ